MQDGDDVMMVKMAMMVMMVMMMITYEQPNPSVVQSVRCPDPVAH